ncbi:MAG: DUF6770 family protein [Chitinophagaceae bacterium]
MKKISVLAVLFCITLFTFSQKKFTLENVVKATLKGSGAIYEGGIVKGYYVFYESEKIDRKTRQYVIQILDQNTNPVQKAEFAESKDIILRDAEFNENSLCFFMINEDEKKYIYKIFDLNGKLKYEYFKKFDNGDYAIFLESIKMNGTGDDQTSNNLIAIPNQGFASILPVRENGSNIFELGYYSSNENKENVHRPKFEERQVSCFLLNVIDNTIYLAVNKKKRLLAGELTSCTYAFDVVKQEKVFELSDKIDPPYRSLPTYITKDEKTGDLIVSASYFNETDNVIKDYSLGIAFYTMSKDGQLLSKKYNGWQDGFSKFLTIDEKGKTAEIGFLCILNVKKSAEGKFYILAEGYKRQFSAGNAVMSMFTKGAAGFTKITVTDLVLMEFDNTFKLTKGTLYRKTPSTAISGQIADYASQHMLALLLRSTGSFGYEFSTSNKDNSVFSFCYSDYEKSKEYKGGTFNAIKFSAGKFTTDKIQLTSNASFIRIFPAKQGFVGILEYFRKEKKIEFRLEKMN